MKRLKVLFVIPSLARAGAETQLVNLVNGLDDRAFDRHLYTFQPRMHLRDRLDPAIRHVHRRRRYKFDFAIAREAARLIDREQIDIVHCTLQFALLIGWLGVRMARRKPALCVAIHTTLNRNRKDEIMDRLVYRWLMRACVRVIFVCESQRRHWVAKFPSLGRHAAVVYNGIDTGHFAAAAHDADGHALRQQQGIAADAPVLCCIARFLPEKGHRLLAAALPAIAAARPDARVLLAGDGPLRAELEERLARDGLRDRVRFLGLVEDVRPVLAAADLTVMPSHTETFSMTMLESLSMGVPVVATDRGGTGEAVLSGQTGWLVPPGDPGALAEAVLAAFAAPPDTVARLAANARQLVVSRFSRDSMIAATAELLTTLGRPADAAGQVA